MSRESLVILLGLFVLFIPVLGVPPEWKFYGTVALGSCLVLIGLSLRRSAYWRKIDRGNGERGTDSFIESSLTDRTKNDPYTDTLEEVQMNRDRS